MNVVPAWLTPRRAAVAAAAVVGLPYVAAVRRYDPDPPSIP